MCLTPYKFPTHLTIATPYPKKENTFPIATNQVWRAMFNCDFQVKQIRQTSFSLSPRVWVGDLLLYNLAWAQLPEDSRNATSFKRIGCEVGASHSMNLQIGGLASDKWKIDWRILEWKYDDDLLPQWRLAKSGQGPTIHFLQSKQKQTTNKSFLETATRTQTQNKTNNKQQNNH